MKEPTDTERLEFYVRFVACSGVNERLVYATEDLEGKSRPEFWFWEYDHTDSTFDTFRAAIDHYIAVAPRPWNTPTAPTASTEPDSSAGTNKK